MRAYPILCGIGEIDEDLIADAGHERTVRRFPWAIAVCAALAVCMVFVFMQYRQPPASDPGGQAAAEEPEGDPVRIIDGSGYQSDTAACYAFPEPGLKIYAIEVWAAMEDHMEDQDRLFVGIHLTEGETFLNPESEEVLEELVRLTELGYEVGWYENSVYQDAGEKVPEKYVYGLFTARELEALPADGRYGYFFYFNTNGDGSPVEYRGVGTVVTAEQAVHPKPVRELTEEEAYAEIGAFLPSSAPEGFSFAYAAYDGVDLTVTWTRGEDSLRWSVAEHTVFTDWTVYAAEAFNQQLAEEELLVNPQHRFGVNFGDMTVKIDAEGVSPEWVVRELRIIGENTGGGTDALP